GEEASRRPAAYRLIAVPPFADFPRKASSQTKIKKDDADPESAPTIELVRNPDILAGLLERRRAGQIIVGFGAATGDDTATVAELGRRKAIRKGADLLAATGVGTSGGLRDVANRVPQLDREGGIRGEVAWTRPEVAARIVAEIAQFWRN